MIQYHSNNESTSLLTELFKVEVRWYVNLLKGQQRSNLEAVKPPQLRKLKLVIIYIEFKMFFNNRHYNTIMCPCL